MEAETITLTPSELAAIIATAVATAMSAAKPMTSGAERTRRYRERKASHTVTKASQSVTCDGKASQSVTTVTPPSPPPLSPTPPIPAPTPVQEQERVHTRERGELFEEPAEEPPPHKRIKWSLASGWQGILPKDLEAFGNAAPAVNLDRALSSADLWLRANPAKAKKQNFYRYLVNWLARSQERGGDTSSNPTNGNSHHSRTARPPVTRNTEPLDPNRPRLNETAVPNHIPGMEGTGPGVYDDGEGGCIVRI